jgi:hypothetical protein
VPEDAAGHRVRGAFGRSASPRCSSDPSPGPSPARRGASRHSDPSPRGAPANRVRFDEQLLPAPDLTGPWLRRSAPPPICELAPVRDLHIGRRAGSPTAARSAGVGAMAPHRPRYRLREETEIQNANGFLVWTRRWQHHSATRMHSHVLEIHVEITTCAGQRG